MFTEVDEKIHILVIDPEPALRNQLDQILNGNKTASLSDNLDNLDFIIKGCASPTEAISLFEQSEQDSIKYPLVILEIESPNGESNLKLIPELWKLDSDLEIIICTKSQLLTWENIMTTVGQSDQLLIIQKPAKDLELHQATHAMVRKWQLSKQSQNVMQFLEHQIQERTQETEEANKQLLQSEKLAAVGQLAAGVAHEINTPAQYVNDNIQAIKDFFEDLTELISFYRTTLTAQGDEFAKNIAEQEEKVDLPYILEDMPLAIDQTQEGIQQISRIVQAMKGFSHMGQNHIAMIDINNALENTLTVTKNSYKYIADVETHFTDDLSIECHPGELNQVFLNLIVNAAHAIEDSNKGRGKITITTTQNAKYAIISISDTGTGIPEDIQQHIFDPFFTTKDIGKGSGQGLNISYRIIHEQHRGTLTFNSIKDKGTTFIITLPKMNTL